MPTTRADKRARLVEAADRLVHRQGFNRTTLADIAKRAKVPLGNVYYYFKTKEEIGQALIDHRADFYRSLITAWNELPDPRKRISAFIGMVADSRERLTQSGCPIGSLCQELHKEGGPLADKAAGTFTAILEWLEEQFRLLGTGRESSNHALHLLSALQGASLLTNTLNDPKLMLRETTRLQEWVDAL
ncbi:MAG: TetR/AcrR family transcriptional regulator [Gammaproteobacteria bacterium]|nr:TetR/AcrR family transcriptional regulator [Gammaproteobacteria bacterium]